MESVKPPGKKLPYQSVLSLSGYAHSLMNDGRLSPESARAYNMCFAFEGDSLESCDEKTQTFLKKVKELWLEMKK